MNLISYFKPLSYEDKRKWYQLIINLSDIRNQNLIFKINDKNKRTYGVYSTERVIRINLKNQINLNRLIETIAHEIAHDEYYNHSHQHKELTKKYKSYIKNEIEAINSPRIEPVRVTKIKPERVNTGCSSIDDIYRKFVG